MRGAKRKPPLHDEERFVFEGPGGYKTYPRSGWKMGHAYLTNERLIIFHPSGYIMFQTALSDIVDFTLASGKTFFSQRDVAKVEYLKDGGKKYVVWITIDGFASWKQKIETANEMPETGEPAVEELAGD